MMEYTLDDVLSYKRAKTDAEASEKSDIKEESEITKSSANEAKSTDKPASSGKTKEVTSKPSSSSIIMQVIPKPEFIFTRVSNPSAMVVLDMKIDALKKLAVDLKLYKDETSVDITSPMLKIEIIQTLGRAKSITYDEATGYMTIDSFESQSFVEPAQGSPH